MDNELKEIIGELDDLPGGVRVSWQNGGLGWSSFDGRDTGPVGFDCDKDTAEAALWRAGWIESHDHVWTR